MRVYELAKKLGMESRTLIPALARLGIKVTSHSNTLDEETTQRACEALQGEGKFVNPPELDKQAHHVGHKEGKGGKKEFQQEISHKDTSKGHKLPFPTPQEEPKKPEKKRVLIKRKKEDGWEWARCCKDGPVFESREIIWEE